jgi:hypothetical protein
LDFIISLRQIVLNNPVRESGVPAFIRTDSRHFSPEPRLSPELWRFNFLVFDAVNTPANTSYSLHSHENSFKENQINSVRKGNGFIFAARLANARRAL